MPPGQFMWSPSAFQQWWGPHWTIPLGKQSGLGLRMGQLGSLLTGLSVRPPSYWSVLVWDWGGNVRGLFLAGADVTSRRVSHIPSVPPGWFKASAGVGFSLAIWAKPWHLKHWRQCGSWYLAVPPLHWVCSYSNHHPGSLYLLAPHSVGKLLAGVIWPGLPLPLQEFGWWGCSYYCTPVHGHIPGHYPEYWRDCCPVKSGSGWPSIWHSADSGQPCPPPGQLSL